MYCQPVATTPRRRRSGLIVRLKLHPSSLLLLFPVPIPRIAIVGRPNAGKSSLMNMIARSKVSIVDPTPGVTRDRVAAIVDLTGPRGVNDPKKTVEIMDTGAACRTYNVLLAEDRRVVAALLLE